MTARKSDQKVYPPEVLQLSHLLPAIWRSLTRATRSYREMPALESQVTILRTVVDGGVTSPAQLADALHLARSTVSNLLRDLVATGLVERRTSTADARGVMVEATPHGRSVLDGFRSGRADVLDEALDLMSVADRRRIISAMPALERLLGHLDRFGEEAVAD